MNWKKLQTKTVLLWTCSIFFACTNNDDNLVITGDYASGVFVVNEGNFNGGNASVSHINTENGQVSNGIFELVNNRPLGDVAQSFYLVDNRTFMVVNNSNKVEVVNTGTYQSIRTLEDQIISPRFVISDGLRLYISCWGEFDENFQLNESYVLALSLNDYSIVDRYETGPGAENMFIVDSRLFVSNSFSNTVTVIDLIDREIEKEIEVGISPGAMIIDSNSRLSILCRGDFGEDNARLYFVDRSSLEAVSMRELERSVTNKMLRVNNFLVISSGNQMLRIPVGAEALVSTFEEIQNIYGFGYNQFTSEYYIADSRGFQGNGMVYKANSSLEITDSFEVGVGPNSFWILR